MTAEPSRRHFLLAIPGAVLAACAAKRPRAAGGAIPTTTRPPASGVAPAPPTTTAPPATPAIPKFVAHGPADKQAVAFTFHGSGDLELLDALLAGAAANQARLTIFAVGQWLDADASIAKRILDAGHELANHTYTHPSLGELAAGQVADEITRCRDALVRHTGTAGRWFRPSGVETPGPTIMAAAGAAGYDTVVGYDIDPLDYQDPGAAAVRSRVTTALHSGAIISLHTGHRGTVDALPAMLSAARAKGLEPVTVTDLLG
jgi:peptidoglycan/xylan/chitin deacetylase (PgdA/CDA1 family)